MSERSDHNLDGGASGWAPALEALRKLVEEHAMKPDVSLPPERDLAARLGVGRRAIRQSLAVLEAEGQIWRRQGKGTFVGPTAALTPPSFGRLLNRTNLNEVMEVRLHLEPTLAELAASRASDEQIAMLRRMTNRTLAEVLERDSAALEHWDGVFHRCIAEASGNKLFLDLFELLGAIRQHDLWNLYRARARTAERLERSMKQHDAIAEAISDRSPQAAGALMREHIGCLQESLAEAVRKDGADG